MRQALGCEQREKATKVPVEEEVMKMLTKRQATHMAQWLRLVKVILELVREKRGLHLGLKHTKEKKEERGHLQRFASFLTRLVCIYLCSLEDKYTKMN